MTKQLYHNMVMAKMTYALSLFITSGYEMEEALGYLTDVVGDEAVQKKIDACRSDMQEGKSFSQCLREQAFILLFEYLFLPQDDLVAIYDENIGTVSDYAKELYTGVLANLDKLDETLASYSKKWKLNRLPKVSLTVLRLALYEMEFVDDLPDSVAINEAVELAKKYGSQEDASFINGVLGAVSRSKTE